MSRDFLILLVIIFILEILRECRYRPLSKISAYRTAISAQASTVAGSVAEASVGSIGTNILTVDADGNIHLLPVSNVEEQIGEARRKAEEYTDSLASSINNRLGTGFSSSSTVRNQLDGKQATGNYLTSHQSLSAYATKTWVNNKGYLTSHQSLSNYVRKGTNYWLRMPAFGNRYLATNGCDTDGGNNDKATWCDSGGRQITLS